ncbi:MAG: fimbrillin family protein [Bacteroidaceae bacterium]|nr:fimbrillin family protein [Bacteroidaceae bacterium]
MKTTKYLIMYMLLACVALYGCQEIEEPINNIPTVVTYDADKVGTTTAYLTGEISYKDYVRGKFLLSATEDFTDCIEVDASAKGMQFYADVEGLTAGTTYYCVLSVTDGRSEVRGEVVEFTTQNRFEFSNVTHTLWENGETGSFITEKNMGTFFFYDEKFRDNNIETYCTPDAPKWIPNADIPLNAEWMMAYAYWPYTQTYEMRDQPYILIENNGQDYLYGACEYISNENTPTNMHMHHAMSRVTFTVNKTEDCDIEGTISQIILIDNADSFYGYGEMNVVTGRIEGIKPYDTAIINCKFELSHDTPNTVERLMFPTSFGENQIQVGIKIAQTNEIIYQYLPAGEWEKGHTYNYPITLTKIEEELTEGDAIDLGLSVMWASKNVGANSPEEYGGYFAWGETEEKEDYSVSNSLTFGLSDSELLSRGIIGEDGNLTASHDVAATKWAGDWRTPTYEEISELMEKCTWEWTTHNGVNGRKVTGPNENSIFLPAAGARNGTNHSGGGTDGFYWGAKPGYNGDFLIYDKYGYADRLYFNSYDFYQMDYDNRNRGYTVRPVCDYSNETPDTPQTTTALIVGDVQVETWGTNNEGGTIIVQQ